MRNVNSQFFRNYIVQSFHFDLTHLQCKLTTGFHTFCKTFQLYRNFHNDRFSFVNLIEVNMKNVVFYRVELNIFQDSVYFFAIDIQIYYVNVRSINQVTKTFVSHCKVNNFTSSVKYTRHTTVLTNFF